MSMGPTLTFLGLHRRVPGCVAREQGVVKRRLGAAEVSTVGGGETRRGLPLELHHVEHLADDRHAIDA